MVELVNDYLDYSTPPAKGHAHLFTGNSYLNKRGRLVMGRGAAAQVLATYKDIDWYLGKYIPHLGVYGIALQIPLRVGVFQVKQHFKDIANPILIENSVRCLNRLLTVTTWTFHINFPGIGYGRLSRDTVWSLIKGLPPRVIVYEKD